METGKDSRCRGKIEREYGCRYILGEEEDGGKRAYTHGYTFAGLQNREREAKDEEREDEERE